MSTQAAEALVDMGVLRTVHQGGLGVGLPQQVLPKETWKVSWSQSLNPVFLPHLP